MCVYLVPLLTHSASSIDMTLTYVRSHSRSLEMAPFYRSCTTSYSR